MKLGEQFPRPVVKAGPRDSLAAVARLMQEHNVGSVVIVREEKPVGIVTDRDLAVQLGAEGVPRQTEVGKIVEGPVRTIHRDCDVFSATCYLKEYEVRRLPIVDD
ncbi:MAG: CBS domain-containing protein, partial [Planctomycetia bacterium]|nr:CBS domain-containing protein [Planctomycetia bacterium]